MKILLAAGLVALPTAGALTYAQGQDSQDVLRVAKSAGAQVELSTMGRHLTSAQAVADSAVYDSADRLVEVTNGSGDMVLALAPTVTLHSQGRAVSESGSGIRSIDLTDWCLQIGEAQDAQRYTHSTGTIVSGDCS